LFCRLYIYYSSYSYINAQKIAEEGSGCFQKCYSLIQINIPDVVTEIPSYCFMVVQNFNLLKYFIQSLFLRIIALLIVPLLLWLSFQIMLLKFLFLVFGHVLHFNISIFLFNSNNSIRYFFRLRKVSINITSRKYHSSRCSIFFIWSGLFRLFFPHSAQKFLFGFFIYWMSESSFLNNLSISTLNHDITETY
jgi:membrane-associated HD superfamily phosphohydrolase